MHKRILPAVLTLLLFGCSSAPTPNLSQITESSAGQRQGDSVSLYWLTERLGKPETAADYVTSGDYGWYQSNYRWSEDSLREVIREGEKLTVGDGLTSYRLHIRFNSAGEAVYQQYKEGNRVFPLRPDEINQYKGSAALVLDYVQENTERSLRLYQGIWNGESFETCTGQEFTKVSFEEPLPGYIVDRIKGLESFAVINGRNVIKNLQVHSLLMLSDGSAECIERPNFFD